MEPAKALQLLNRQIRDIQAQAEKIVNGDNSPESIESFARYSLELKSFIRKNIVSEEIQQYMGEIPDINFERSKIKFWQYFIFPSWFIDLYKEYHLKNQVIQEIRSVKGKYATLELLVRGTV